LKIALLAVILREDDGNNFSMVANISGAVFLGHFTSPPSTSIANPFHGYLALDCFITPAQTIITPFYTGLVIIEPVQYQDNRIHRMRHTKALNNSL